MQDCLNAAAINPEENIKAFLEQVDRHVISKSDAVTAFFIKAETKGLNFNAAKDETTKQVCNLSGGSNII